MDHTNIDSINSAWKHLESECNVEHCFPREVILYESPPSQFSPKQQISYRTEKEFKPLE